MIGLSPTRPGILKASPLVVVTEEMSPWGVTASQLIVPVGRTTMCSASGTSRKSSSGFRLARQCSHTSRACSVSRSSSLKPYCSANRLAPSPTRKMWFVYLSTRFATTEGVWIPSSAPTAPARLVGPCMHDASSCTTPSAFGSPPYPTESSFGSSSSIFTPSIAASSVSAPCITRSNAFCTARSPLALATTTGFAAQREVAGRGRGGRIGCGTPKYAPAAMLPAAAARNSRRDTTSLTACSQGSGIAWFYPPGAALSTCPPCNALLRSAREPRAVAGRAGVQRAREPGATAVGDRGGAAGDALRGGGGGRRLDGRLAGRAEASQGDGRGAAHRLVRAQQRPDRRVRGRVPGGAGRYDRDDRRGPPERPGGHPGAPRRAAAQRRQCGGRLSRQPPRHAVEAPAEPHRQRRAQLAEPRDDPRHRLLAQGVPRRGGARPAAVQRHASVPADARQDARRHGDGGPRAPPPAAAREDEVRDVEPRVPRARRRVRGALDAAPGAALSSARGGVMETHEEWIRRIDAELEGELSLAERALLARHLLGCASCAAARASHLELRVALAKSAGDPHARIVPRPVIRGRALAFWVLLGILAGLAGGWFGYQRWGGPGGSLEDTRAALVAR